MRIFTVYKIKCNLNDKVYIGYTKNSVYKRFREHIRCAEKNELNKFYNAIRYYGKDNFEISILFQSSDKNEALEMEIHCIKEYNAIESGYNTRKGGTDGSVGCKPGIVFTEEHKRNISINHHNVSGENNPFYGKKHSEETKKKIANREYPTGEKHRWYGNKCSTQFKCGKDHPLAIQIIIDGIEYESISQAQKKLGLSRGKVLKYRK